MDEELGMVVYEENQHDLTFFKPYSEITAQKIDLKVKTYLELAFKTAKKMIEQNKETLTKVAKILIDREYIAGEDFAQMIDNPEKITKYQETGEFEEPEILNEPEKLKPTKTNKTKKNTSNL